MHGSSRGAIERNRRRFPITSLKERILFGGVKGEKKSGCWLQITEIPKQSTLQWILVTVSLFLYSKYDNVLGKSISPLSNYHCTLFKYKPPVLTESYRAKNRSYTPKVLTLIVITCTSRIEVPDSFFDFAMAQTFNRRGMATSVSIMGSSIDILCIPRSVRERSKLDAMTKELHSFFWAILTCTVALFSSMS